MNQRMEKELNGIIATLFGFTIEKFEIDLISHKIIICVNNGSSENPSKHQIVFDGVSAYCYIGGDSNFRLNPLKWDHAEISDMVFHNDCRYRIDQKNRLVKGFPVYTANANFVIEIWSSLFLIEANQITIDENIFRVGYPVAS